MTILVWLNLVLGIAALFHMLLVLKATSRHFWPEGGLAGLANWTAGDFMRFGIFAYHLKGLLRIGFYDVYRIAATGGERVYWVAGSNALFCAIALLGSLAVLYAIYIDIPDDERGGYDLYTAPWHPNPPPLRLWKR